MYGYGISAGLSEDRDQNQIVKLQGRRIIVEGGLESLAGGVALDGSSPMKKWSALTKALADELDSRGIYPLAVDCALSLPVDSSTDGRPFENLVQTPFKTPAGFKPWPKGPEHWLVLARLWTEVAFRLVGEHGWTLWTGQRRISGSKILLEVYPRLSWATVSASLHVPVEKEYSRSVEVRDRTLEALDLTLSGRDRLNDDLRDAAICAVTASKVATRTAGFLGVPAEPNAMRRALVGGGIAVPWLR